METKQIYLKKEPTIVKLFVKKKEEEKISFN